MKGCRIYSNNVNCIGEFSGSGSNFKGLQVYNIMVCRSFSSKRKLQGMILCVSLKCFSLEVGTCTGF